MIDAQLNKMVQPILKPLAQNLIKFNIKANYITFIGFLFGICCAFFITQEMFVAAIFFLFLNRLFDGLDGVMARISGPTDLGAFYDIICDFIFYSAFPLAFIILDINNSYHIGFLTLSFVATQSTFLTSAWIIEKNKIDIIETQKKSFFYSGGITEGFETIICFAMMLTFYDFIAYISYTFGILCWITFIMRIIFIKKLLDS